MPFSCETDGVVCVMTSAWKLSRTTWLRHHVLRSVWMDAGRTQAGDVDRNMTFQPVYVSFCDRNRKKNDEPGKRQYSGAMRREEAS